MDLQDIKNLIEMLKESDVTDLQIEREGMKVRLRREKFFTSIEVPRGFGGMHHEAPQAAMQQPSAAMAALPTPAQLHAAIDPEAQRLLTVTAPLVGTFYRSPSPDNPPFIEVGARVKKGQVLCIIEAMKLMNEIESEVDGKLVKALVDNGHSVEYGEPLFLVEPD